MDIRFELFVEDVEKSLAFYIHILQFKEIYTHNNYHSLQNGNAHIGINRFVQLNESHYLNPTKHPITLKGTGVEFVFEVDDIHKIYEYITHTGYLIHEPLIKQEWGLTDFRLVDPDGYYLRITSKNK